MPCLAATAARHEPSPASSASASAGATPASWTSAAGTKFQLPHLRRQVVERGALLARARELIAERRLSLVCAPAGFGKTVLLAQLAAQPGKKVESVWLSLDEDDNDANRLFAALLQALQGVALEWSVDPQALMAQVDGVGVGTRAAVAGLINALCSYDRERLLLFIDDLHRITDAGALQLLDDIIERLPPEVGVVVGSRVEPELALARWRVRGELGELRMSDLQFDEDSALIFGVRMLAEGATPELVRNALQRTEGWAAGLQLIFGSTQAGARASADDGSHVHHKARRHLFEFLAHEVLTELPEDLRGFALDCSVLPELTPALCAAVSGRDDAPLALDALYRRHLFLSALDDGGSTLRFHDLFRDFLANELERRDPLRVAELHRRAAGAEPLLPRAVMHWLKAQAWDEALALMVRGAKPLLAVGSHAMLERWIEQLPDDVRKTRRSPSAGPDRLGDLGLAEGGAAAGAGLGRLQCRRHRAVTCRNPRHAGRLLQQHGRRGHGHAEA
jgi:LuxR family transcriptional regulator, maltose regulon positive regulatory protein